MNLLFKRDQTVGPTGRVKFKLWSKTELDEDEEHIVRRYQFDEAKVVDVMQPTLLRNAVLVGLAAAALAFVVLVRVPFNNALAVTIGIGAGWLFYDRRRESLYVRDLIHGRYFSCDSVVDLARKEAWLAVVVSTLRQVMETAKHWDGTETIPVEPLSKQEAKYIAIKGL